MLWYGLLSKYDDFLCCIFVSNVSVLTLVNHSHFIDWELVILISILQVFSVPYWTFWSVLNLFTKGLGKPVIVEKRKLEKWSWGLGVGGVTIIRWPHEFRNQTRIKIGRKHLRPIIDNQDDVKISSHWSIKTTKIIQLYPLIYTVFANIVVTWSPSSVPFPSNTCSQRFTFLSFISLAVCSLLRNLKIAQGIVL